MEIIKITVGQLATNCYVAYERISRRGVIIDPGDDAEVILNIIKIHEIDPVYILATHGHFDHILAVNELKMALQVPFLLDEKDCFLLSYFRKSALHYTYSDPGPAPIVDKYILPNDVIAFGNEKLKIIETPGHTPGGICLYSKAQNALFRGDTMFSNGEIGRTDLSYSNKSGLLRSINLVLKLDPLVQVYPGHGEVTTISEIASYFSQK